MRRLLILFLSLMVMSSVAQAQDDVTPPLIAVSNGDIYAISPVDGSIKQLTHHPSIGPDADPYSQRDLAMSSDGRYLAYKQTPRFFQIAMKNNLLGNYGFTPADIVVLDLTTGQETVIATQQPNVSYTDTVRLWYRDSLVWSPTDDQLAYVQYRGNTGETNYQVQLMIYDAVANQTSTFVGGKEPLGEIAWIGEGIAAGTSAYDVAGGLIVHHYLNEGMLASHYSPYGYGEYMIVDSADVIPHDGRIYLMDVMTGVYNVVQGTQSSVARADQENSLVFFGDDNDTRPSMVINTQNGNVYHPPTSAPYAVDFALSPDGQQFAYILLGTNIHISDLNGKDLTVDFKADTLIWGAKTYVVADQTGNQNGVVDPTSDFDNARICGTLADVGLVVGGQGQVITGGGPNRIHSTPSADADVIGQIPEGDTFAVPDEGQQIVCSGGIRWVQVEYQGTTGWTAEGADGKAFLEPVS